MGTGHILKLFYSCKYPPFSVQIIIKHCFKKIHFNKSTFTTRYLFKKQPILTRNNSVFKTSYRKKEQLHRKLKIRAISHQSFYPKVQFLHLSPTNFRLPWLQGRPLKYKHQYPPHKLPPACRNSWGWPRFPTDLWSVRHHPGPEPASSQSPELCPGPAGSL